MCNRLFLLLFFVLSGALRTSANTDPVDNSKAGTDGPYVFYRDEKVVVKYVVMLDSGATAITRNYSNKQAVELLCMVPESGDKFSFSLRENLNSITGSGFQSI